MTKRIDPTTVPVITGTLYPSPFDQKCRDRSRQKLGDAAGLDQLGVNLLRLGPGAWSSQRHWHTHTDEFVYVLSGEVTLVTNAGEEILKTGECAGFKAGEDNGHCLQNHTDQNVMVLEIGTRSTEDTGTYSDIDMKSPPGAKPALYLHRDDTPYQNIKRRGPGD